ncbi:GMC oxidoreductase domain-containing protein [Trichoderma breve]|uniref:GMC oxidoreductase domain-containing protein n=1 Tax=Trichoderma breve TaxID=2034170 RepID=A0A9W9E2W6_9HYPO|nr:GMC oxidoreductase domain-containing protein [Trichoderma breve]KAJ4855949.1 GMC oxidoreductase domain-containing protein [Trichoderma breve]
MASPGFTKAAVLTLALCGLSNGLPQSSSNNEFHKRDPDPIALPTYDYVVVGSGPGGGPVAARLALAGYKVLLMDAGDDEGNMLVQEIPLLSLQSTETPSQEWDYFVQHYDNQTLEETDSKFTWELPDGSRFVGGDPPAGAKPLGILYPRAGTLGGCAGHNVMITTTPQDSDWETVASITGDNSWNPDSMRQYWERVEDSLYLPNGTSGHGFNGWLETSLAQLDLFLGDSRIMNIVRAAATVVGNEISSMSTAYQQWLTGDINSDSSTRDFTEGLFRVPEAVKQPSWDRAGPRDFILQVANAVNSDGSRKYHLDNGPVPKAIGVDFLAGQTPTGKGSVNVTREVIISAGTFNTPQLLKLSGVGPAAELKSFDIPVVVDLPGVGTGMSDRYEVTVVQESTQNFTVFNGCTLLQTPDDPCLLQWENNHTSPGIYSSNGIVFGIPMKSSVASPDTADLLMAGLPANFRGYFPGYSKIAFADAQHFAILVLKAHNRNYAGTNGGDEDVQAVYDGVKLIREIYGNLSLVDNTGTEVTPGPDVQTEEEIKDFIRREAWGHHACCTARIGADNDSTAVLDSEFRVRGTTGLRVVDASVFPEIPGYFIVSAVYMISEKAADVIIADAKASS